MSALLSTFRDRFESRKWLSVALVLGLLLVAYVLPVRLVQQGVSAMVLLAVLALAVLVLPRPWLGLALLLAYGPFAAAVRFAGASNLQSLAKDIFALGVVGVWLVDVLMSRRRLERGPLDVLLVLYCALAAVQMLRAPSLLRGALALKILITYVPIYFLVYHNPPRSRRQLQFVLGLMLSVTAVTALYGLYQYFTFSETPSATVQIEGQQFYLPIREGQVRVLSTFAHANVFALYLALMITLAASLLLVSGRARGALLAVLALAIGVLPLTLSRMGWIGLALGLLVLAMLSQRLKWRLILFALLVVGLLILFVWSPQSVRRTLDWSFTGQDVSFTTRSDLLYWAYRMTFVELPLGCGLGVLPDSAVLVERITHSVELPYACFWRGYGVQSADTVALAIGVQMGAIGYLLFALIHGVILWQGMRLYRRLNDRFLKALAGGLVAYFVVMTFSNFFSGSTTAYPVVDLYFWFFAGLLLSLGRIEGVWAARSEGQEGGGNEAVIGD